MKNKSFTSFLLLPLLAVYMLTCGGCTNKQFECGLILLITNDECNQKLLQAQNEYNAAVSNCIATGGELCIHINDPVAKAACFQRILDERLACINTAKAKLDAATRTAEACRAANKAKYDDCMNGK